MLLIDLTIKSLAIIIAFFVIGGLLKNYTGRTRYTIWKLAFISAALVPFLSSILPSINLSLVEGITPIETTRVYMPADGAGNDAVDEAALTSSDQIQSNQTSLSAVRVESEPVISTYNLSDVLAIIWLVGTALTTLFIVVGYWYLSHLRKGSEEVSDPRVRNIVKNHQSGDGRKKNILVLCSEKISVPITWGWRTGIILLPDDYASWPEKKLEINLIHELEHIQRWDFPWNMFINLCCAVYWFNPLVWLGSSIYRRERERSIDEIIVNRGISPSDYAYHLIETASSISGENIILKSPLAVSKGSKIKERIVSILDISKGVRSFSRRKIALIVAIMLLSTVPISAVNIWKNEPYSDMGRARLLGSLISSDFDRSDLPQSMCDYMDAYALMENKKFEEAEPFFIKILEEYPFSVPSLYNLDAIYFETQRYEQSLNMIARRLLLRPRSAWYFFYTMAITYEEMKELDRAFHWIYRSIETNSSVLAFVNDRPAFEKLSKYDRWKELKDAWANGDFESLRDDYVNSEYNSVLDVPNPVPVNDFDLSHLAYVALTNGDHFRRIVALELIAGTGNPEGMDIILGTIRYEPDPDVIQKGLFALISMPYENVSERLIQFCEEVDNPWVHSFAGYVIGLDYPETAARILRDATFTEIDHECHENAISFLKDLPGEFGLKALNFIEQNHPSASIRAVARNAKSESGQ